jgi:FeS assembly SUF system regulator
MLKVSKLSDYSTLLMAYLAQHPDQACSAVDIAKQVKIPEPTVRKLLKVLTRAHLLESLQGAKGGYRLARAPECINLAEVVQAVDGPIALTECSKGECEQAPSCVARPQWQGVNQVIYAALANISIAALTLTQRDFSVPLEQLRTQS